MLAGMRPISNVVDVTNYVMLERCRPLHAFDLGRLAGRGIVVRLAEPGEKMTTLDGVERVLARRRPADLRRRTGRAGHRRVMGGAAAEVSDATTEILLESAYFEASGIAKTSKRLGLRSEASARFERGVDPNDVAAGSGAGDGAARRGRAARSRVARRDRRVPEADRARARDGAHRARQPAARHRAHRPTMCRRCSRRSASSSNGGDRDRSHVASRHRARDRPRRGSRAPHRARQIERTVPSNPEKIGSLTTEQRERRLVADVLIGAGYDEVYTLPLLAAADLARAGRADRCGDRGREPAARRGVGAAAGVAAGPAARGRAQCRARQSRCRAVRARPRVRAAGRGRRVAGRTPASRVQRVRAGSCERRTSPTATSRCTISIAVVEALAQELRVRRLALVAAALPPGSIRCGPRISSSTGSASARSVRSIAEVVDALALAGAGRRVRDRRRRVARGAARAAQPRTRSLAIRRRRSTLRSSSPTPFPRARSRARCARPAVSSSSRFASSTCSVPTRSAPARSASRSR